MAAKRYKKKQPNKQNNTPQTNAVSPATIKESPKTLEHQIIQQQYSGPMPPPEMLAQYNHLIPDAAERILAMAEANSIHNREMENKILAAEVDVDKRRHTEVLRGQIFGGLSTLVAFSIAGLALMLEYPLVAGTICSTTVVALVTVFITGRKADQPQDAKDVTDSDQAHNSNQ